MNRLHLTVWLSVLIAALARADDPAVAPDKPAALFNGKDLTGWTTWLKATGGEDPQGVFSVKDGVIHMLGGDHRGYIATTNAYRDYHFFVEYKWGKVTDGGKYVRNSGVLLHGTGKDGSAGAWMTSIEVQLAQGCEGDLIVIRGKDADGKPIPATLSSKVRVAEDKKTRWDPQGQLVKYTGKQFWWSKHQPFFEELLDTRGKDDLASPVGQWTKVECICKGDRITIKINGETVNEALDVFPSSGKILLQNEGHEVYFRNVELRPVKTE